jgi:thioredoxin 1
MNRLLLAVTVTAIMVVATVKSGSDQYTYAQNQEKVRITFIELGSVNCLPCKAMQPVMKKIEKKYKGKVKVVFYDVWTEKGEPFARLFGVQSIPTQVFLDEKGKEFFRHVGFFSEEAIDRVIQSRGVTP